MRRQKRLGEGLSGRGLRRGVAPGDQALTDRPRQAVETEKTQIRDVVSRMQEAWNRGDFRGCMEGFKNPDVVFVSGGRFQDPQYGFNTRLMRKVGGRWVIALNHVSASETPPTATIMTPPAVTGRQ